MPPTRPISAETLLSHAGWVRALARGLVRDRQAAEDVVQETWLAALERGPREGRPLSSWLARVARNFARKGMRSEARRDAHERLAPQAEGELSPSLLFERAALHKELVEAVMGLGEPYRSTILLRYFEDLAPRAIARREGIPVRTVKTRLARALEKLRASLDARSGGDRASWMAALGAFAKNPIAVGTGTTVATIMSTNLKLLSAGVLLSALVVTFMVLNQRSVRQPRALASAPGAFLSRSAKDPAGEPRALESLAADSERLGADSEQAPSAARAAQDPLDPDRDLHGRVTDSAHLPLRGARIEIRRCETRGFEVLRDAADPGADSLVAATASDERGEFRFRLPRARPFDLYASLPGYADRKIPSRYAGEDVRVVLTAGCTVFGRVTRKSDGAPCAGARVHAVLGIIRGGGEPAYLAVTDERGAYRLDGLPPGGIEIDVESSQEVEAWGIVVQAREGATIERDIALEPGALITGIVTDAGTGSPISGAEVRVDKKGSMGVALTDVDGRYEIRGLHTGFGVFEGVRARAVGFAPLEHLMTAVSSESIQLDFQLRAGRAAKGRVLGPDDWPLADAVVIACGKGSSDEEVHDDRRSIRTNQDGTFRLPDLAPRVRHTLFVRKDGCGTRVYDFPAEEDDKLEVDFGDLHLPEPATVLGRVVDEKGAPVADAFVGLNGANFDSLRFSDPENGRLYDPATRRSGRTDQDGRFGFTDLSAGTYRVRATGMKGCATSAETDVQIAEERALERVELVLRVGLVFDGRVVDPAGDAVPGVSVSVYREPFSQGEARLAYDIARGDGSFHIQGLDEGTCTIQVGPFLGEPESNGTRDLASGRWNGVRAGTRDLILTLPRAAWIEGTVVGPDGSPAADVRIQAEDAENASSDLYLPTVCTRTDAHGRFRVKVRASSRVNLQAFTAPRVVSAGWQPEFATETKDIAAGSRDVQLKLARWR
jgi:RNA polymerase sigma-70 factor (ECF subfamily)